jgi:protein-tyrosine phosphatase
VTEVHDVVCHQLVDCVIDDMTANATGTEPHGHISHSERNALDLKSRVPIISSQVLVYHCLVLQLMPDLDRIVATTSIHNFRDFGGYPVVGGGRLALRTLYRSAAHHNATEKDLDLVAQCGLTAIVDLRGKSEREKAPCRRPPGLPIAVYSAPGDTAGAPHDQAVSNALDATAARRNMCERYGEIPFRPMLVNVYRQFVKVVAEAAGPTLVYCAAGKDRTGVLVALLHTALGVHRDDIFEDYLLTNSAGDTEARVAALRAGLEGRLGATLSEEAVRVITGVEPLFLETAFGAIAARYGNTSTYLKDVLGLTPAVREALAERLVR